MRYVMSLLFVLLPLHSVAQTDDAHQSTEDEMKTFAEMARPANRPEGAPAYSDVLFSSRWKHPRDADDPHDTFSTAEAFRVTQFVWVYTSDSAFIGKAKSLGYGFQCSLNSMVTDWPEGGRERGRITALDGSLVTAPWMRSWKSSAWGCCNHPAWRASYIAHASAALSAGADSLQMDDPTLNLAATNWGGCFCEYCVKGFRQYLRKNLNDADLKNLGIDDIEHFDYGEYLRKKEAPSGDALSQWKGDPLRQHFVRFQEQSVRDFYTSVWPEVDRIADRRVLKSCNNYGGSWDGIYGLFDCGIAELNQQSANPATLMERLNRARELNKAQVFTLVSEDVLLTRKVIATLYALGGHLIVPWDVYLRSTPEGSDRYYGKPEDFADLYAFVRDNASLFDGYEEALVVDTRSEASQSDKDQPFTITGGDALLEVRAIPGKTDAPLVMHIVDWSDADSLEVRVDNACLFRENKPTFTLLRPDGSRIPLDANSEGNTYVIHVPNVTPWGIVTIERSTKSGEIHSQ